MEPLEAVSLVGTVVQLVEFATKLTSKAAEVHRSRDGVLTENANAELWNVSLRVRSSWEQRKCSCKVT